MRSTPEQDKTLRARLQEAVDHFGDGSADQFGRLVGYANGGYIREILNNKKPVREALIGRVHAHPGMAGWFDAALSSVSAADLAAKSFFFIGITNPSTYFLLFVFKIGRAHV